MKKGFFLFSVICLAACGYRSYKLSDGITRVTDDAKAYKNQAKFDASLLNTIDTGVIYLERCTIGYFDSSVFGSKKTRYTAIYYPGRPVVAAYRFYANGCFNLFMLDPGTLTYTKEMFDPGRTGERGIYYYDRKNRIRTDLFTQISGAGAYGMSTKKLELKGDSLFVIDGSVYKTVFLKKKIPKELLSFRAAW